MTENLQIAIQASLSAGKRIMEIYDQDFVVDYKEDQSPLTQADQEANEIINGWLKPTGIPIISEENKAIPYEIRRNWQQCWIVDPVDGTKEFIKRNGEFTVNIALVTDGMPTIGVIYAPALKTLYFTDEEGSVSYKADLHKHETAIAEIKASLIPLQPKVHSDKVVKIVGSRSHMNKETLTFVEDLKYEGKSVNIVSKGSSLKFCLVAEGKADVYPRFAPTMEWDTAAGHAICRAVGFNALQTYDKTPLRYNKESHLNPYFIVA